MYGAYGSYGADAPADYIEYSAMEPDMVGPEPLGSATMDMDMDRNMDTGAAMVMDRDTDAMDMDIGMDAPMTDAIVMAMESSDECVPIMCVPGDKQYCDVMPLMPPLDAGVFNCCEDDYCSVCH